MFINNNIINNNIINNSYYMLRYPPVTSNNHFIKWLIYAKAYIKCFINTKYLDMPMSINQPLYKVVVASL